MSDAAIETVPVILLGNRVRDKITTAEGIAVARSEHLYGCTHIHIKPTELDDKGRPQESVIVDLVRCEFIDDAFGRPDDPPVEPALGKHVRDTISGFDGVVIVTMERLHGTPDCCIEARRLVEGKPLAEWFSAGRLQEITEQEAIPAAPRGPGSSTVAQPRS